LGIGPHSSSFLFHFLPFNDCLSTGEAMHTKEEEMSRRSRKMLLSCNWMSAASVADVVVTSGERHEGKAGMVLFAGKTV